MKFVYIACERSPMPKWIQHPETGKLVPAEEYFRPAADAPMIMGDIDPFVSPIDKSVISSRAKLRAHNKRHGVTDMRDYGDDWFARKAEERARTVRGETAAAKQERIEALRAAIEKSGG